MPIYQRVALVTTLLAVGLLAPVHAGAAPRQAADPPVTAAALDGAVSQFTDCRGKVTTDHSTGYFRLERPADATTGDLAVDVSYVGTLVSGEDYPALPDPIVIPDGEERAFLSVTPTAVGTITVTIEPGSGYVVGDPAGVTVNFPLRTGSAVCRPLDHQVIHVGEQPEPVETIGSLGPQYYDTIPSIVGTVPPGLTFEFGGSWKGAATTAGTYHFVATFCLGPCLLEAPVTIDVLPADVVATDPPPTAAAAPAEPVAAAATFTG